MSNIVGGMRLRFIIEAGASQRQERPNKRSGKFMCHCQEPGASGHQRHAGVLCRRRTGVSPAVIRPRFPNGIRND